MNNFIEQIIAEAFKPKTNSVTKPKKKEKIQQPSSHDKGDMKWYPTRPTPWSKPIKKSKKKDVDEVVDEEGNFISGDAPGNPNAFITSKSTTDQASKVVSGQMGSYGVGFGGQTGGNKTLKYWAEADMHNALGAEVANDTNMDLNDTVEYFEDELEVTDPEEALKRAKEQGKDASLPKGTVRLVENPRKYIEEYLAKKAKNDELVPKMGIVTQKKQINPITTRQLKTLKQTLKDNGLTVKDITEYLEDNE